MMITSTNPMVYTNPVVYTDFPDPDIIRVGDVYYMATTTMHFTPGCDILRSYDLVHWEFIAHALNIVADTPEERLECEGANAYGRGMWAPSLRYHRGTWYVLFAANDTHTSYLLTADDPCGPWRKRELDGFYHDTLGERDRAPAVARVREFLLRQFDAPPAPVSLRKAHLEGFTRREADALARPLPALSPRGLYWSATRAGLRLGGALSEGVALGHSTGFDSGSTLDYVYRNEARGAGPVGRLIDRNYLDSIGWRGIRQRKLHVEELLRLAIARLRQAGAPVHVLDIAAGHGRYVLEALQQAPGSTAQAAEGLPDSILLRDYSDLNVTAGAQLIRDKRLESIAQFRKGDAFDPDSIASVAPRPTLGIVSGLYELFPDNDMVTRSLSGMAAAIPAGGYLVYTGQPWHPQLELIARALTSHRGGQAWVMRRRTQQEMDELVAAAGFEKCEQRVDEWGVFTVSLAQRRAA